jgi:hypothetical protein
MSQGHPTSSRTRGWHTKTVVWSCIGSFVAGAVLRYGAGFYWLGQWQTGEQVQKRLDVVACVRDFLLQPDRAVIYAQLKDTPSSYQRRQLIREHKLADSFAIADQCDDQIRGFDASSFPAPAEAKADANKPA